MQPMPVPSPDKCRGHQIQKGVRWMSEENKQQIERICTEVNKLDAAKQEIILAFAQGLVCGTKHTEKSA
nr:MAG TPA: hypothetical protein [Caudoviricetes sp.]